jgi:YYY domain-containing protein
MVSGSEVSNAPTRRSNIIYAALIAILAVALWLRVFGPTLHAFDWGDGNFVHPDENFVGGSLVTNLQYPNGIQDLFNADSKWNPAVAAVAGQPAVNGHPAHDKAGFNYGSLPLYLIKIFTSILSWMGSHVPGFGSWQNANPILAGRVLSGIFDTITVFLVFLLAKRLAGERTGLLAAAFATFAVLSIQLAHFTTVDSFLGTFATGTVLASVAIYQDGRTRDYALVGIWLAAALATKASAVPLVATVAAALLWRQFHVGRLLSWETVSKALIVAATVLPAFFLFQPYTFVDWSHFRDGVQYQSDLASGSQIAFYTIKWHGTAPILYPLTQLTNYSLGLPLALLAYAGVVYEGIRSLTRWRHAGALVAFFVVTYFVSAGLLYMKYLRYMEPIVPSLCVLAAIMVAALVQNRVWLVSRYVRAAGYAVGGIVLLLTACYGLAYQHIYDKPLTRLQASCWIYQHVPSGARTYGDSPDEGLPFGTCDNGRVYQSLITGDQELLDYYDDSMSKVLMLSGRLAEAQYYFISSARAIETFQHYGDKYPYMQRFYALLLGSKLGVQDPLGYTLQAHIVEHPQLGPWTFTEAGANQNYNEYDHPPVWIFKNTGNLSATAITGVITDHGRITDPSLGAISAVETVHLPKSLMLSLKDIATNQHTPTYASMFPADSLPMRLPALAWLLLIEVLGLLALPISMRLLGRLSDCGLVIAKTSGILLLAWFAWILASLHLAEYSRGEIALCLLPIAGISLAWGVRLRDIPTILRPRLVPVLLGEAVFLIGFFAFLWIRMIYPDLWHSFDGGEKTMDFSFLNAIVRSRVMPPYDPWFSGGYLNYYYYGHFTVATLLKLVGITPAIAINLALPTFFALSLASCVSIAYSLIKRIPFALLAGAMGMLLGNLYGAQALIGDLQAASPVQQRLSPVTSAGSNIPILGGIVNLVSFCWSLFNGIVQGAYAVLLGLGQVVLGHSSLPSYPFRSWAWDGSRAIDNHQIITEFPYWTFLYGDPHAHLWDIPFALCIVAVALNLAHGGSASATRGPRFGRRAVTEVDQSPPLLPGLRLIIWPVLGILLGAIGPTNPWDLAAMFLIIGLVTAARSFWLGAGWLRTIRVVGARLVVLGAFAFGFYQPFYSHFQSFYSHIGWTILRHQTPIHDFVTHFGLPLYILIAYLLYSALIDTHAGHWIRNRLRAVLFTLYYWDRRQDLPRYFSFVRPRELHGAAWRPYRDRPVDAVVIGVVGFLAACAAAAAGLLPITALLLVVATALILVGPLLTVLIVGGGLALLFTALNYLVLALLVSMASLALILLLDRRQRQEPALLFLHVLMLTGIVVAAAGEIVYVKDFYDGSPILFRSNTVFKLYEDAWLLLNISAAVALARLLLPFLPKRALERELCGVPTVEPFGASLPREHPNGSNGKRHLGLSAWTWLAGVALLVAGAAIYPLRMTPERLNQRATTWPALAAANIGPTLDGMAFVKYAYPDEYDAIQWINATIPGSPVMLQSRYGDYGNFSARVTMFTGLPTVVDWGFEAAQQRYNLQDAGNSRVYPEQVGQRERYVVDVIYSTPDPQTALRLLHAYNVSYVYVGSQERGDPFLAHDPNAFHGYPAIGLAKFPLMAIQHQLELVYSHGTVQIYKVLQ